VGAIEQMAPRKGTTETLGLAALSHRANRRLVEADAARAPQLLRRVGKPSELVVVLQSGLVARRRVSRCFGVASLCLAVEFKFGEGPRMVEKEPLGLGAPRRTQ
jgi:hypothetical protein